MSQKLGRSWIEFLTVRLRYIRLWWGTQLVTGFILAVLSAQTRREARNRGNSIQINCTNCGNVPSRIPRASFFLPGRWQEWRGSAGTFAKAELRCRGSKSVPFEEWSPEVGRPPSIASSLLWCVCVCVCLCFCACVRACVYELEKERWK